jgi:N-acetylneuraminic acid mutarotase
MKKRHVWTTPMLAVFAIAVHPAFQAAPAQSTKPVHAEEQAWPASNRLPTGTWKQRQPMKVPALFAGTVVVPDGRIFIISGLSNRKLTNAVRVYDPEKDTWTEASPIPTPRTEPGAAVGADGKIYVVGGGDRDGKYNVLEVYDPKNDSWARLKPMPTPREGPWAVAAKGADGRSRIYALGGRDHAKPGNGLSTVEAYDPATDTWTALAPMPTYRHGFAATPGPDGRIYALGGTTEDRLCKDTLASKPTSENPGDSRNQ